MFSTLLEDNSNLQILANTSLDFKRNFPQENVDKWLLWRLLMRVSTNPKKHFILTISVKESQYRSTLKDEPFPDSKETLKFRFDEYFKYVNNNKFVVEINCEKSIELIHKQIITYLKN